VSGGVAEGAGDVRGGDRFAERRLDLGEDPFDEWVRRARSRWCQSGGRDQEPGEQGGGGLAGSETAWVGEFGGQVRQPRRPVRLVGFGDLTVPRAGGEQGE
jgi:hypothetical protein